jgi:hypothetical protein
MVACPHVVCNYTCTQRLVYCNSRTVLKGCRTDCEIDAMLQDKGSHRSWEGKLGVACHQYHVTGNWPEALGRAAQSGVLWDWCFMGYSHQVGGHSVSTVLGWCWRCRQTSECTGCLFSNTQCRGPSTVLPGAVRVKDCALDGKGEGLECSMAVIALVEVIERHVSPQECSLKLGSGLLCPANSVTLGARDRATLNADVHRAITLL